MASNEHHRHSKQYESLERCSLQISIRWRIQLFLLECPTYHKNEFGAETTFSGDISNGQGDEEYNNHCLINDISSMNDAVLKKQHNNYKNWKDEFYKLLYEQELRTKKEQEEKEREEEEEKMEQKINEENDAIAEIDPLTAMFMEQNAKETRKKELTLKYRKERARRKRGLLDNKPKNDGVGIDHDSLSIIDKDIDRLSSPDISIDDDEQQQKERKQLLREMLYIFSQQHKYIGYRQGMHEIASYLLYVVQMDQKNHYCNNNNGHNSNNYDINENNKLDRNEDGHEDDPLYFLYHYSNAYHMLEYILKLTKQAFDIKVSSNSKPLQDMTTSILRKLKNQLGDSTSHNIIRSLPVPPQIYCTKWVRLLFSREVVRCNDKNENIVLSLWNHFMQMHYIMMRNSNYDTSINHSVSSLLSSSLNFMNILETTAACRIFLIREPLKRLYYDKQNDNQSQMIDLLMNMKPLQDIQRLINENKRVLLNIKYNEDTTSSTATAALLTEVKVNNQSPFLTTKMSENTRDFHLPSLTPEQQKQKFNTINDNKGIASYLADSVRQIAPSSIIPRKQPQQQSAVSLNNDTTSNNIKSINPISNPPSFSLNSVTQSFKQGVQKISTTTKEKLNDPRIQRLSAELDHTLKTTAASITTKLQSGTIENSSMRDFSDNSSNKKIFKDPLFQDDVISPSENKSSIGSNSSNIKVDFHEQLALRLDQSVMALQEFAMSVMNDDSNSGGYRNNNNYNNTNRSITTVPAKVWDALADIGDVKQELRSIKNRL